MARSQPIVYTLSLTNSVTRSVTTLLTPPPALLIRSSFILQLTHSILHTQSATILPSTHSCPQTLFSPIVSLHTNHYFATCAKCRTDMSYEQLYSQIWQAPFNTVNHVITIYICQNFHSCQTQFQQLIISLNTKPDIHQVSQCCSVCPSG